MNCTIKKRLIVVAIALALSALLALDNAPITLSSELDGYVYMENIAISVDCDTASLSLVCSLFSINSSLIHYPSGVNLNDTHLENCTFVTVMFNSTGSMLTFSFNNTSQANARSNADAMITSMNAAFDVTFTHESTIEYPVPYPYVIVLYTAEGKPDMATFLGSLKTQCVESDVQGFSEALPTLFTNAENEMIILNAVNVTENWSCTLMAEYNTSIATGSGNHTIDVLHCLNTSYLQPSGYANLTGYYMWSYIIVTVNSSDTISFVECQPDEVTVPIYEAGWYVPEKGPGNEVSGIFYWGNNTPMGEVITFTFGGTVIPEFTTLTTILAMAIVSTILLYLRKRSKAII